MRRLHIFAFFFFSYCFSSHIHSVCCLKCLTAQSHTTAVKIEGDFKCCLFSAPFPSLLYTPSFLELDSSRESFMNLLQFWHVTLQITAVHLPKLAWLNLLLTLCMTLVHIYLPCFSVFPIHVFPLLNCKESASILQPFW